MIRYKYAETYLHETDIEKLKIKTGEKTTKEALYKAIQHYLKCAYI